MLIRNLETAITESASLESSLPAQIHHDQNDNNRNIGHRYNQRRDEVGIVPSIQVGVGQIFRVWILFFIGQIVVELYCVDR